MNKKIIGALLAAVLVLSIGIGVSFAAPNLGNSLGHRQDGTPKQLMVYNPHQFKQLMLRYATDLTEDPVNWTHVPGNEVSGFKLCLDPTVEYYYLDIMKLRLYPLQSLGDDYYPFYVDTTSLSAEYIADWQAKIATFPAEWQERATDIFLDGTAPIFYLKVEAGVFSLVDGFQRDIYPADGTDRPLRVNGDYTLGTYNYVTHVEDDGLELSMTMTFRTCECDKCVQE